MLIVCDNCGAEYEVDVDEDVGSAPGRGLRFRCSACGHTFTISDDSAHSGEFGSDIGMSPPGAEGAEPPMLLKQEGKVYQVEGIATLQRWIVERRVLREDLLSIGGLKWEPVGSRRDLQVFFHLVENVERAAISGGGGGAPPPLADLPERDPVMGRVPWEEGPALPPVEESAINGDAIASPEADEDEADDDEGTDAGLPLSGLPLPISLVGLGGDALSAPDPHNVALPEIPTVASPPSPSPLDDTEEAGPGPAPAPVAPRPELARGGGPTIYDDMLFPEETEELPRDPRASPAWEAPAKEQAGGGIPGWALALGAAVLLGGLGWWASQRPAVEVPAPPPAAPVVVSPTPPAPADPTAAPADPAPVPAAPTPARAEPAPARAEASPARAEPSPARAEAAPPARAASGASASKRIDQGWAAIERGSYGDAREAFSAALEVQPGSSEASFGLGYAYEKLGNQAAAVRLYCTVSTTGSGDSRIEAQGRLRALDATCE